MFVADLRLTLATLTSIVVIALLLKKNLVSPDVAGPLLALFCLTVLAEAILREARSRRK